MSIDELVKMFEEARNTAGYQFEDVVLELTEQLCQIMEAQGVSRADLARKLGKTRAWVTKLLRGDRNITLKTITDAFWALGYRVKAEAIPMWSVPETWEEPEYGFDLRNFSERYAVSGGQVEADADYVDQAIDNSERSENAVAA